MTLSECGAPTPGYLGLQILRAHTHMHAQKRKKTIINAKTATGPENPDRTAVGDTAASRGPLRQVSHGRDVEASAIQRQGGAPQCSSFNC